MINHSKARSSVELPPSLFQRGLCLSVGRNGEADLVEAHKWFNIAAAAGDRIAAQRRDELAQEMTREEVAAALRAARLWITHH